MPALSAERTTIVFVSTALISACGSDTASAEACFEAARAHAEAIERYRTAPEQHPMEVEARKDVVLAAIDWKKRACSGTAP